MSTRGCVGIGTKDKWRAVYNHYDSYPTGLGAEVWEALKQYTTTSKPQAKLDLKKFADDLLRFDDWRAFLSDGVCAYCGKKMGQPHSMRTNDPEMYADNGKKLKEIQKVMRASGTPNVDLSDWDKEAIANVKKCGFPDPEAKRHLHNEGNAVDHQIDNVDCNPLFIEWAYIIDPDARMLHIFVHDDVKERPAGPPVKVVEHGASRVDAIWADGTRDYGHCIYALKHVTALEIDALEPDWAKISKMASKLRGDEDEEESQDA